jgi:hypothetical protein
MHDNAIMRGCCSYGQYWTPAEYTTATLALDPQDANTGSIVFLHGAYPLKPPFLSSSCTHAIHFSINTG